MAVSASDDSNMKLAALPLLVMTKNTDDALKLLAAEKGLLSKELPTQIHHFATNKSSRYTKLMEPIAKEFNLKLDEAWNKQAMPHLGRHPNKYHDFVLKGMRNAREGAGGDQAKFLELFDQNVKQPVINNPTLLRKSGWK